MTENNLILIGGKPLMNYVTAVVMQFTTRNASSVTVRSRGKFISRAVDVAEVVRNRFLKNQIKVDDISIGSEEFENKEGKKIQVSTIDITLASTEGAEEEAPVEEMVEEPKEEIKEEKAEEAPKEEEKPEEKAE